MPKKTKTPTEPRPRVPMPIRVQESDEEEEFRPLAVSVEGNLLQVESVDERVEEDSEWWENEPVYKMHYRVTLSGSTILSVERTINSPT